MVRPRPSVRCVRAAAASAAIAALAPVWLQARDGQAPSRSLVAVSAPVGPGGTMRELYSGSHALLIGVSRYDAPIWTNLESIPGELNNLAAALRQSGFETADILLDPTGSALRDTVERFIENHGYTPGHRLLFFFAGHGTTLDKTHGYFVPRDAPDPAVSEASFRRIALSMERVRSWAREIKARHVLFAFDSCFSGSVFAARSDPGPPPRISELTASAVRQFLTAGRANEQVPAQSVFTPMLISGLKGAADANRDGYVTGTELGFFVYQQVPNLTSQRPQFGKLLEAGYIDGDLVFIVPGAGNTDRIIHTLNAYRVAYEARDVEALRRVYPSFANLDALKTAFADLRVVTVNMSPSSARITMRPDGTALAELIYSVQFTSHTGAVNLIPRNPSPARFHLRVIRGEWIIEKLEIK